MRADRKKAREEMMDMIQALIDDDELPDPDDGPRICYVVLLPDGFVMTEKNIGGAHSSYDKDFPFSGNRFWAGWIGPAPDLMQVLRVVSHEVVETLVDPESDAWRWIPVGSKELVSELCDGSEGQTAFVNDVRVQAYWSQFHNAPIIPIDADYGAQLSVHLKETSRVETNHGPFVPSNALCSPEAPDCCFTDDHFEWHAFDVEEEARISINTKRFRSPNARWFVNNHEIRVGEPALTLTVEMETYSGLTASIAPATIAIDWQVLTNPPRLVLKPQGVHGNFDVFVRCEVTDASITGAPNINVVATPQVQVGFRRQETLIDDAYGLKLGRCYASLVKKFTVKYKPTGTPRREEGINWVTEVVALGLPAYVRASHYEKIREFATVARATRALLGEDGLEAQRKQVLELAPVLGAVARRVRDRSSQKGG
jgi:hypothetical protein